MPFMRPCSAFLVFVPAVLLAGCSALLPRAYTNYTGQDAATVFAQDPEGFVGTFYLSVYEKTGNCYDRKERYELGSNVLPSGGTLMSAKVRPGQLMALQQLYSAGQWAMVDGKMTYNKDGFTESRWVSFIPEPGKRYFLDPALGAREIPSDYPVTAYTKATSIFSDFKTPLKRNWDPKNRCQHLIGGS